MKNKKDNKEKKFIKYFFKWDIIQLCNYMWFFILILLVDSGLGLLYTETLTNFEIYMVGVCMVFMALYALHILKKLDGFFMIGAMIIIFALIIPEFVLISIIFCFACMILSIIISIQYKESLIE